MTEADVLIEHIVTLQEVSSSLLTWTLSILGGSILLIVSTSYNRPTNLKVRLAYLSYIPAWIFVFLSIYQANTISQRIPAAILLRNGSDKQIKLLDKMAGLANSEYGLQIIYFQLALSLLAVWLIFYLLWWIFTKQNFSKN